MLRNYVKIAWRSLNRHRYYSVIKRFGLALGLAAGAFALLYVMEESSFDNFHKKSNRIYRVLTTTQSGNGDHVGYNSTNGWPVGYALIDNFPEVERSLYMRQSAGFSFNFQGTYVDDKIRMAGPEFFDLFNFPLLQGDGRTALTKPFSIVLSERLAQKYFPNEEALGKIMTANDTIQFAVTGVVKNPPANSHIQFDLLVSFSTWESGQPNIRNEGWFNWNMVNYVLLKEGADVEAFQKKATTLYMDKAAEGFKQFGITAGLAFEPLPDTYLKSNVYNPLGPKGRLTDVLILSGIALLIIILAVINFVNLTTARSVDRAREVGLRKVSGSTQGKLVAQFLSESLMTTAIALFLSFVLLGLALPILNLYTEKTFTLADWADAKMLLSLFALWAGVGICAGLYPAFVLSRFAPLQVLRGQFKTSNRGIALRRTLVVAQFFISAILIAAVFIIGRQINFMNQQSLGFNKDQVLVINTGKVAYGSGRKQYRVFKNELQQNSFVLGVSASNATPGSNGWRGQVAYAEGKSPEESVDTEYLTVDYDYASLLDLKIIAGRNFKNDEADKVDGLLINEETARVMGWGTAQNAVGKRILSPSGQPAGLVLGVFKDYHQHGLQEKIQPVVMDVEHNYLTHYLIKFQPGAAKQTIEKAEATWKSLFPGYEFKYTFLDDSFAQQYQTEEKLNKMFLGFAMVALVIAAIGLFGLSAFMVVHRTKEVGVRKILGAPVFSILSLLTSDFVKWVVVANVAAWPLLYWMGQNWLNRFAYHTTLGIDIFAATLLISLLVTISAIGFQAIQAIQMNPVNSLRSE